ncbi:MAG: hypothetical protein EBX37_01430 [Alphaproteobacteria bacterium]|nr:hypothetical protein [Alphaproteobacteria bacterium]
MPILEIAQCCVKRYEIFMPVVAGEALRTMEKAFATEQQHPSFPRVRRGRAGSAETPADHCLI